MRHIKFEVFKPQSVLDAFAETWRRIAPYDEIIIHTSVRDAA